MGGGPKVPYPKHVWSPAGGWYAQPGNWRQNTIIAGICMVGIMSIVWNVSAEREVRAKRAEPERWYPSRLWSKQMKQWAKEDAEAAKSKGDKS